jgi:hypothetical protein
VTGGNSAAGEPSRLFLGSAYTFGGLLGLVLGFYGVFLVPVGPRPGGIPLSVGVACALVGNGGAAMLVRWFTGTRLGAMIVLAGWVPIVLWFGSARPEGDLLVRASVTGYLFLVVGVVVPVVVAVVGPPRRGLFAILAAGPHPHPHPRPRPGSGPVTGANRARPRS